MDDAGAKKRLSITSKKIELIKAKEKDVDNKI
jgi:hypothetical protein